MSVDPRTPCLIGVATRTWHPEDTGDAGAPEPLVMWETVARAAAADAGSPSGSLLDALDAVELVYCQTWQYDDPVARLCERLGVAPRRRFASGIGGTTPQVLVADLATRLLAGELDVALVAGAEALATRRRLKQRGERYRASFPPAERREFPWEAPFHPAEVAHEVFQAWLTFALFENARRAHLGTRLDEYRSYLGELWAPFSAVAARNPDAWFRVERSAQQIVTPTRENRMVGYPYTKYMVSAMDVDMAAALLLATHEAADWLGVPPDRRVYLRGWCYATDPTYVAEHRELWCSPAMSAAGAEALRVAGVDIDDVAHLDLYSCFGSSVGFACDALGVAPDDGRGLTVTGGLPYHGGAGSDYMTHSIATMARVLRADPGSFGLVSGVGMHMTKHVFGVYSTEPPGERARLEPPDEAHVQAGLDARSRPELRETHTGLVTVAAYSVVHGKDGAPEWALLVCDLPDGARVYARADDPDLLAEAERTELVGTPLTLTTSAGGVNVARP